MEKNVNRTPDQEMVQKLKNLEELLATYSEELRWCRPGYMTRTITSKGSINYKEHVKEDDHYLSRGITRDKNAIYAHCRKRFLLESIKLLTNNIKGLKKLLRTYRSCHPLDIINCLPTTYADLPEEAFYYQKKKGKKQSDNPYHSENLRHTTIEGFKVRSKSELYIGAQLEKYKISYRYEEEVYLGDRRFFPDFIITNVWTNEPIYWEHCGMVNDEDYMSRHYERIITYAEYGIVPWKNLIVTYDDEEGNLNAIDIDLAIRGLINKMNKRKI